MKIIGLVDLAVAVFAASAAVPVHAQSSSSKYMDAENTGCKIWNPNPMPDEKVYWLGKCADGYGAGNGLIVWANMQDQQMKVSVSDVTLERGKTTGTGTYYSSGGDWQRRIYEDGETVESGEFNADRDTQSVDSDLFMSNFFDGLVRYVTVDVLTQFAEEQGHTVTQTSINNGVPLVEFKDNEDTVFYAYGSGCVRENMCAGLVFMHQITRNEPIQMDAVNAFNSQYALVKATRGGGDPNLVSITHYSILDHGQRPANILATMKNFRAIAKKADDAF